MDLKYFEKWNLSKSDFEFEPYRVLMTNNTCNTGVAVRVQPHNISISCHSKKNLMDNKEECLKIIDVILSNYVF